MEVTARPPYWEGFKSRAQGAEASSMAWPSAEDFVTAALSGADGFDDAELREARPAEDAHGSSILVRGENAIVIALDVDGRRVALRCFLRERADRERRYEALARYLERHRLDALVPFTYLPRGIRVDGRWFPALKMEWVEGEPLDARVRKLGDDAAALRALSDDFFRMMGELARHGIAHGDLQPSNIRVTPRGLRLVDYDTTFAPGMETLGAAEPGDPDHQHAARARNDFSPSLDHFSAWVIHLSLLALSLDPSLHARFGGENRLLFRREDFAQGPRAPVVGALRALDGGEVLVERFLDTLQWEPLAVPPLEDLRLPPPRPRVAVAAAAPAEEARAAAREERAPEPTAVMAGAHARVALGSHRIERASLGVLVVGLALLALFGFARSTPWPLVAVLAAAQLALWFGYLAVAHRLQPVVRERREALRRLRVAEREVHEAERALGRLANDKPIASAATPDVEAQLAEASRAEEAEIVALEREVALALEALHDRRLEASADALGALDAQEAQVVDEARSREEGIRQRYRAERARLHAEAGAATAQTTKAHQEAEATRARLLKELEERRRALAWAQEEARAYADATFARFVARVVRAGS